MEYTCLVCGFDKLKDPIYDSDGNGTYEICVCCGFEYGCDDFPDKNIAYKNWRESWIKQVVNGFQNQHLHQSDGIQNYNYKHTLMKRVY